MIYPKFLKKEDIIGVTALSSGCENAVDNNKLKFSEENFATAGYKIKATKDCTQLSSKGRSANKKDRAEQFNKLIEDEDIKAIISLSGGDFLLETLPYINFEKIKDNPKWIQGFSDTTGILYPITTNLDISTIYAANFKGFAMKNWHKSIKDNIKILEGEQIEQTSFERYESQWTQKEIGNEDYVLDSKVNWKNLNNEKNVHLEGRIIGGCLDVLLCLIGTEFDGTNKFIEKYKNEGIIWYFDNCELNNEEVLRAMWQFEQLGYFKHTKGIMFGRSGTDVSAYNISFKETVKEALKSLEVPVILDVDIGHKPPQLTIINGAFATVDSSNGKGKIKFKMI